MSDLFIIRLVNYLLVIATGVSSFWCSGSGGGGGNGGSGGDVRIGEVVILSVVDDDDDDEGEGTGDCGEVAGVNTPRFVGVGDVGLTILSTADFVATTNVFTGKPRLAICFNVKALIGCIVATWLLGTCNTSPVCVVSVVMLAPLCTTDVWFFKPDAVL